MSTNKLEILSKKYLLQLSSPFSIVDLFVYIISIL